MTLCLLRRHPRSDKMLEMGETIHPVPDLGMPLRLMNLPLASFFVLLSPSFSMELAMIRDYLPPG